MKRFLPARALPASGIAFLLLLSFALAPVLAGCDSGGDDEPPPVDEVIIVGTQVENDFVSTGQFGLSATPLDLEGNSILRDDLSASIELETVDGTAPRTKAAKISLTATVNVGTLNQPSDDPLAVSVNIDGSGSMDSNDPNDTRIDGAQSFVEVIDDQVTDWEVAMFTYRGNPNQAPNGTQFFQVEMLQDFSDDVAELTTASDGVGAFGGTPTYSSLAEILIYSEDVRPAAAHRKGIVLLSDGFPGDATQVLRDSVCADAGRKESPIFSIGLGPASDLDANTDPSAVAEMRGLSNCTGGAYAGIDPDDVDASTSAIYNSFATATSLGNVVFNVQVQDDLSQVAPPGTRIAGTLTVESGGQQASGDFAFTVPQPTAARTAKSYPDAVHPGDAQ
jgi:hypothetical protein